MKAVRNTNITVMLIFSLIGPLTGANAASASDKTSRILYINSYHRGYIWSDGIEQGLRERLNNSGRKIDVYVEFMDTKRFPDLSYLPLLAEVFVIKHGKVRYDAIVVSDNMAFDFAIRYREKLFPNTPIIFCGYNSFRPEVLRGITNVTGVNEEIDFTGTIDMALAVHPKTQTLVFLTSDYYTAGQRNQEIAENRLIPAYSERYRIIQLRNMYLREIEQKLAALPADTLVFVFGAPFDNRESQFIAAEEYYRRMAAASSVPVYSFWDFILNTGMMGGNIITGPDQGRMSAELTLRVLDGTPADHIPVVMKTPSSKIFDFNAMKRFGISEKSLPPDSIIINKPDSFYQRYKSYVWIIVIAFMILSAMVIFLTILLRKSKILSTQLRQHQDQLEELIAERTAELRQSEERFRTIFEKSPVSIEIYDADGVLTHVNQACMNIFGISDPESVRGINLFENPNFHAPQKEKVQRGEAVRFEYPYDFELVRKLNLYPTSKSGVIYLDIQVTPLKNDQNSVSGYMVQIQDITERKQAEISLRESERRLSDIINFLPDATFVIDTQGKVLAWNRAMESMSGIRAQDMIGKGDYEYAIPFYGERRPILIDLALEPSADIEKTYRHIQRHGDTMTAENHYPNLRGKETWLFGTACILRNSQGQITGAIESIRDITNRKRAELERQKAKEAAESANKAKSVFLASMSHELRTPLNGILGYAQILRRDPTLSETHRYYIGVIERSGNHLLELINDILDISKIEAEKTDLAQSEIELPSFFREIVEMIRVRAEEKGLIFHCEVSPDIPSIIRADSKRLRQILLNLLGNAVKFTERGKIGMTVRKKCIVKDDNFTLCTLHFAISDTGIGIPEDRQEDIFSPFTQIHTEKIEGTGLGLTISRKLVHLMGGELSVSSRVGHGSTFSFEIAYAEDNSPKTSYGAVQQHIVGYTAEKDGKLRILIADDVSDNRRLLINLLAPLGFDVTEAFNGRDCVEKAAILKPDLILTDIVMPEMSGIEAAQAIRGISDLGSTPIIVVSASAFEADREQSRIAGCNDFLPKPIVVNDLLNMLHRYLPLKWVYAEDTASQEESTPTEITPPPPEKLDELIHFANMGDIGALACEAQNLLRDEHLKPFASELFRMVQAFEMKRIRVFLSGYSDSEK